MSLYVPRPGDILSHDIADFPEGIVLPVDKPYRWTSADVIRKLKWRAIRHFGKKNLKVGHAGTLDPLATGVLLVCIGNACKRAQQLQDHDKEYIARIRFGATTPSYDLEKEVDRTFPFEHITADAVRAALPAFLGEQEQVAPLFSAKSVDGVRAYELARKLYRSGRTSELDAAALDTLQRNKIVISELELLQFGESLSPVASESEGSASSRINVADTSGLGLPEAMVRVACSKGTYIRAFARDLGEALGSGAHLSSLVRSRSGDFRISDALSLEQALGLFE
ncbi:MAG: tRNA pseudouridine(55) synthase TruB [Bacteroidales bacterium]|nr:tRNA pseudouridine(55) synthase TruB [Bacteroidales bacterium]